MRYTTVTAKSNVRASPEEAGVATLAYGGLDTCREQVEGVGEVRTSRSMRRVGAGVAWSVRSARFWNAA
ncbi:uncharacterized protein SCHCODRAFT_02549341 [Schizophyllum commune H4-8]|uniref:uncharacterized protein n=1 Tax=Schizophyllum commune (strain H4-8 / FGSC 9210) TaxID=578458 RepID=UPI00215E16EC|nr:uncharacterized protein SCHCODRAFT_02549341 [Schizophyllum commune H4-8]KAI5889375.1 hypothetical protein SCHCODRAFT_02549341 [Schizophyllum commune H4-8]